MKLAPFAAGAAVASGLATIGYLATSTDPASAVHRPEHVLPRTSADVAALRAEVADLRSALLDTRSRLASSERQIVNFQIFVNKLVAGDVAPPSSSAVTTLLEREDVQQKIIERLEKALSFDRSLPDPPLRDPATILESRAVPPVGAGASSAEIYSRFGTPDKETRSGARTTLHYHKKGLKVILDGATVKSVEYFGEPTGEQRDVNGNWALYQDDWYRPAIWQGPGGISVGMFGAEVIERLGKPKSATPDVDGRFSLWYPDRDLVIRLDKDRHHSVIGFRQGGGSPVCDVSGNVW